MPFIETPPVVTPPVLTTAQKKTKYKLQMKSGAAIFLDQMIANYNRNMTAFWNNADGLTPQECADALGTEAKEAVMLIGALKEFVNGIKAGSITGDAPHALTLNDDGTVVVGS